ncbi:MAG: hypothetical protein MUC45_08525 [Actinomycetia bacterium]|jgi:hypothetical protein|nr:hypothetical protein [Actinomycetes bacterium]
MTTAAFEQPLLVGGRAAAPDPADPTAGRALLDPQGTLFVVLLAVAATVALVVLAGAAVRVLGA